MSFFTGVWHGLDEAFFMFWETLWALVLGFVLSGAVQAFVSRTEMREALGEHRPKELGRASFFGVISSSCSYASSALAKSLFARGADFTASMVFMVASTNLVVELGIVLWLLIGWQFALAEFVGGAIMIVLIGLVLPRVIPRAGSSDARDRLNAGDEDSHGAGSSHEHAGHDAATAEVAGADEPLRRRLRSRRGWGDAAGYTVSDLTMLRKELVIGFVVAGYLAALVPDGFWRSLFLTGHGFWSSLENVVLGPFLAIISFVCSVGNVPLAAALWQGGISFGGVVSFVFADLITLPLLSIYRKYYGTAITLRTPGRALGRDEHRRAGRGVPVPVDPRPRARSADDDRAHRLPVELHDRAEHRRAGGIRAGVLALPAPRRQWRPVRQGPGLRHAGRDRPRPRSPRHRRTERSTSAPTTAPSGTSRSSPILTATRRRSRP